jgi:predicted short-subunit dehydrogenase-like oxidoreductase (DUF2520 family)
METLTYGLVGRGRVAHHMARYLELEGQRVATWHRGSSARPEATLSDTDIVLLAISDDALVGFIADNPALGNRPLVHFSGSLTIDGAAGFHPLMTFGSERYDLETYRSIPFVVERGGPPFREIFPCLRNESHIIDPALKPLYHALCVLSGNFTTILWAKAMRDFGSKLGLPSDILRPYLEQTAANTLANGRGSLTGSLARGERGTIARDLDGLAGDPYREVYLAVARAGAAEGVGS